MPEEIMNELCNKWNNDIASNREVINPNNNLDWYSIAIGWALSQERSVEDAIEFANEAI